jgi:arylformamidase
MKIFDVSVPVRTRMIVYEGDPDVHIERTLTIAGGGLCNVSRLDCGVHTGTHIDAPVHFIDGAAGAEAAPLDALMGPAYVIDATDVDGDIDEAALGRLAIPANAERLIFKTKNSRLWALPRFSPDFIGLTGGAARAIAARGVRLAGIDYLSIAPKRDPAPAHVALLGAGVVILEGLDLRRVESGWYELRCLPLLIEGADGAPARAVLLQE